VFVDFDLSYYTCELSFVVILWEFFNLALSKPCVLVVIGVINRL
jgi:hypothetical protein